MFNNDIDNQTASLIALVDLYVDKDKSIDLNIAARKASRILVCGIRNSSYTDKIDFCTLAIYALSKNLVNGLSGRRVNSILEKEELDFINSQNVW
jgi:hypothetical protein